MLDNCRACQYPRYIRWGKKVQKNIAWRDYLCPACGCPDEFFHEFGVIRFRDVWKFYVLKGLVKRLYFRFFDWPQLQRSYQQTVWTHMASTGLPKIIWKKI